MLLSTAYLGNIQYYTKLISGQAVIDLHENYRKQSFRNRCDILTANGVCSLIVPVCQPSGYRSKSGEVRIDYSKKWQHQHWHAILSAYRNSAYFEHYEECFAPFYTYRYELLAQLNQALQERIFSLLRIQTNVTYSDHYQTDTPINEDFRDTLSPKTRLQQPDPYFSSVPYYQVFAERYPFAENLSILDLLFCEGPSAVDLLHASAIR